MRLKVLTVLMSCFICKPLNYQIAGRDTTASDLDFFRPINVNEMQANWDQATFRFILFFEYMVMITRRSLISFLLHEK